MSDSGTTDGQPREESREGPASVSAGGGSNSTSTSTSPSPNKRPIKKRNHSTIDDGNPSSLSSSLSEELEAAESLVTVSTAAFVSASASASAPAPKRPKGDNSDGNSPTTNNKNNQDVMEEEDAEDDEEGGSSSSEQSEGATSSSGGATTSSLSGSDDCADKEGDNTTGGSTNGGCAKKKKKAKKPGLRKGKWTPEEEAYSTAVIRHFRAGLLRLPDGLTLRGYLAEKLNCDPMRITKKYAGAACLGKRTFSFQDRIAIGDIALADQQLNYLEERFKLRVKTGHAAIPLPPYANMGAAGLTTAQAVTANAAANIQLASSRAPPYAATASSSSASSASSSMGNGSGPAPAPAVPIHAQQVYPQQAPSGTSPHIHVHHGLRHPGMPQQHQQQQMAYQGPPQAQSAPHLPQMQQQAQGQPQPQQIALAALLSAGLSPATAIAASPFSPQSLQAAIQAAIVPALTAIQQAQQHQHQPPAPSAQQQNVAALLCNAIMAQQQQQHQHQQQQQSTTWAQAQAQQILGSLPPQALSQVLLSVLQQQQQQPPPPQGIVQGSSPFQARGMSPPAFAGVQQQQQQQQQQPPRIPPQQVIGVFNNANGMPIAAVPAVAAAALAPSAAHRISPVPMEASNPAVKQEVQLPSAIVPPAQVTAPTSEQKGQSSSSSRGSDSPRSKEDEEAGTALFGFLSALRKGHEEALAKAKAEEEEEARQAKAKAGEEAETEAEAAKDSGASSSALSTGHTDKDSKNAALEKATKKSAKRSTFRTVSSLTDQPSSDASSASASKESGSSDEPQRSDRRVNIKQIGPPYSLPKQCSDISAGAGEADGQGDEEGMVVGNDPYTTAPSLAPPASVTDLSSGVKTDTSSSRGSSQNDSSLGDSDESASSENKSSQDNSSNDNSSHGDGSEASSKDTTSSEDDEDVKDTKGADKKVAARRKSHPSSADGEPKAKKQKKVQIFEFTSKNVADHNTRMNALHAAKMTTMSPAGNETKNPPPKEQ